MSEFAVTDVTLLEWLDNAPERLEAHLAVHPGDADRLDVLTAVPRLGEALREALVVPEGLATRVHDLVRGDPARRAALATLGDVLGTSWRTLALLWTEGESP